MGVIGGCGLGIGYISPVKTLITWFPDRPGHGNGDGDHGVRRRRDDRLAAVGLADGALLQPQPMSASPETFVVLGIIYFCFMSIGAIIVRVPQPGWRPEGYVAPVQSVGLITTENVHVDTALRTPQFWLLWWVLCLNVTAGIGVLGQASAMAQEMFPGRVTAVAAAGFVGLLSIFNMGGRFVWATHVGLHWAEEHLLRVLHPRHAAVRAGADGRAYRQRRRCS